MSLHIYYYPFENYAGEAKLDRFQDPEELRATYEEPWYGER